MTGDTMVPRLDIPARTADAKLIVVVRAPDAADYDELLEVLIEAGIRSVELTLTTPGTLDRLPELLARYGDVADIGVGTVVDRDQLDAAVRAGAHYLVTPIADPDLVTAATRAGVPIVPGGLTPTELFGAWSAGAAAVKIFPANVVGPGYLKDLRGPFPGIAAVPSGGVDLTGAATWLNAGAAAVSVGGPLLGDALRGGDMKALRDRTVQFVAVCGQPS
ncbi:bifunctional 4-hydroxy-2-oxoglutarate aldolase/2-dehydro-3-deoxy-phosphogluconate aldolase [Mycobacterium sp. ITM-2016-00316]|uniref:bifunctional 4-hydroxy-2-oxoglutarate aldolase/2-dehydro-3-deoxy-phosphogluconate aldolase n=1 Tax=Mycobacterium sp. ITM-2016-00316 TaxID=2099695 RepID=UPI000CFA11CD|nr:bifunctional 4-hydroxy-2-oxoglutarate aldolase/2-dehydro-3-deoxy-phosphogluconate aldolase [Mycobacterium sp. ITM-2016-00316]WNG79516.1 bifunctional 4-hydroxy-2-oxoglutarate aldolase/2-dehydro-3-deoxy-phosphogluconate aldolase [Mycobacterium sp. ITM-2016-00316]